MEKVSKDTDRDFILFADRKPVWKAVFYARRHQWVPCDAVEISPGTVSLYVAGQAVDGQERLDILHFDDPTSRFANWSTWVKSCSAVASITRGS